MQIQKNTIQVNDHWLEVLPGSSYLYYSIAKFSELTATPIYFDSDGEKIAVLAGIVFTLDPY